MTTTFNLLSLVFCLIPLSDSSIKINPNTRISNEITPIAYFLIESEQDNLIHKFKSTAFILERNYVNITSTTEDTYHVFNYREKYVKMISREKGNWVERVYNMTSYYREGTDYVIICDDEEIKEIWFSLEFNIIGHDYHSGLHLNFYGIERIAY